jgi:hypothetical protein
VKVGSDELSVLRALLHNADRLAPMLEPSEELNEELVCTFGPQLLRRSLQMAVNLAEKAHDLRTDDVSLYLEAEVLFAKEAGHHSHRDVAAAVVHHTHVARQTVIARAKRLADKSKAFAAAWDRLRGVPFSERKSRTDD